MRFLIHSVNARLSQDHYLPESDEKVHDEVYSMAGSSLLIFFFQAEDGIRDLTVTGVQTCALPILRSFASLRMTSEQEAQTRRSGACFWRRQLFPENAPRIFDRRALDEIGDRRAPEDRKSVV